MKKIQEYADQIARCSHCNYCQAQLPVFQEDKIESVLPRNRIQVIQTTMIDNSMPLSKRALEIIDVVCSAPTVPRAVLPRCL
jgi:Fe-S oxidoreductase